jgi:hypothetical protein
MVVNADSGKFITQRQIPKLCQVRTAAVAAAAVHCSTAALQCYAAASDSDSWVQVMLAGHEHQAAPLSHNHHHCYDHQQRHHPTQACLLLPGAERAAVLLPSTTPN